MDWTDYFIDIAEQVAEKSKDPSTKVGAVIVGPDREIRSTGYNGFPRGVDDQPKQVPDRYERPEKYSWTEHAERNAILNAARVGTSCKGCILYLSTNPTPCVRCARAVIQAGIKEVVGPDQDFEAKGDWEKDLERSREMLSEAGVYRRPVGWRNGK